MEWNVPSHGMPSTAPPTRSPTRSFISRAALLVKVTARICPGKARPRGEDVGDARRQHARLAGAGAGQNQHRAVERFDGRALLRIEAVEIGRRGLRGCEPCSARAEMGRRGASGAAAGKSNGGSSAAAMGAALGRVGAAAGKSKRRLVRVVRGAAFAKCFPLCAMLSELYHRAWRSNGCRVSTHTRYGVAYGALRPGILPRVPVNVALACAIFLLSGREMVSRQ